MNHQDRVDLVSSMIAIGLNDDDMVFFFEMLIPEDFKDDVTRLWLGIVKRYLKRNDKI